MIDLPTNNQDDVRVLADWVELATSCDDAPTSLYVVADALRSSGVAGTPRVDNFVGEFREEYEGTLADEEGAERRAQTVWDELHARSAVWREAYPYTVDHDTIRLPQTWRESPAYHMLLILDISRRYPSGWITPDFEITRLFEKIVQAAKGRLLGGSVSRFGWPIEYGWPTDIQGRVATLAEELGLRVGNLEPSLFPADSDRGLDVAGLVAINGSSIGTAAILTQCATGQNWKDKTGEPSIEDWQDILDWSAKLVKGFAVPWRLDESWDYRRVHRRFNGAIVLDRPRLIALRPDEALPQQTRDLIVAWCEPRLIDFPRLV